MACTSTAKILGKIPPFYACWPLEIIGVVPRLKVAILAAREIGETSVTERNDSALAPFEGFANAITVAVIENHVHAAYFD